MFRHDLTDSLSQEANIVMFGHKELSDSDQDEQSDVQPKHQLSFRTSVAESGEGASHMMTVVPSTPERRVVENNHEAEAKNATVEHAKTEKKKGVVEQKQVGKKANGVTLADRCWLGECKTERGFLVVNLVLVMIWDFA